MFCQQADHAALFPGLESLVAALRQRHGALLRKGEGAITQPVPYRAAQLALNFKVNTISRRRECMKLASFELG